MFADLRSMSFLGISHFGRFLTKWANIYISSVLWLTGGGFYHFKSLCRKSKKWRFSWPQTCEKLSFLCISHFFILTFQVSCGQPVVVLIILKGFAESKKKMFFHDRGLTKKCHFWAFHIFEYLSPKWANVYTLSVLLYAGGGFHHFKSFFRESNKMKFFMTTTLWKMSFIGISHCCIFLIQMSKYLQSSGQLVVIFIILKGFPESWKKRRFSWPLTYEKLLFLGISHICIFLIQMSKYLNLKFPVVNWWWFSLF